MLKFTDDIDGIDLSDLEKPIVDKEVVVTVKRRGRPKLTEEERNARMLERATKEVEYVQELLCIRINPLKFNKIDNDLSTYERTRGIWRVGQRAFRCKHAIACVTGKYNGIVTNKIVAIYDIINWVEPNIEGYSTRDKSEFASCKDRYEFNGIPTQNENLQRLVGKIFREDRKLNGSNPISFRPIEGFELTIQDIPEKV